MNSPILDRVSYHAVYEESIPAALRFAREHGFTGVQIADESLHLSFERLSPAEVAEIAALRRALGMRIALHAPDECASLFQASSTLQAGILSYYERLFEFARAAGAELVTIHLGQAATFPTDTTPEQAIPEAARQVYLDVVRDYCIEVRPGAKAAESLIVLRAMLGDLGL